MFGKDVALTDLGKIATRELVKENKPSRLEQNKQIAKRGVAILPKLLEII